VVGGGCCRSGRSSGLTIGFYVFFSHAQHMNFKRWWTLFFHFFFFLFLLLFFGSATILPLLFVSILIKPQQCQYNKPPPQTTTTNHHHKPPPQTTTTTRSSLPTTFPLGQWHRSILDPLLWPRLLLPRCRNLLRTQSLGEARQATPGATSGSPNRSNARGHPLLLVGGGGGVEM
jgi:hypothetical protein